MLHTKVVLLAAVAATSALLVPRDVSPEVNQHISIDMSGQQILKYVL
jgi:hypothetical protein